MAAVAIRVTIGLQRAMKSGSRLALGHRRRAPPRPRGGRIRQRHGRRSRHDIQRRRPGGEHKAATLAPGAIFGGNGEPSGVDRAARRSAALRRVGLKLRMPSRARVPFMRFTNRVRSLTRHSRSDWAAWRPLRQSSVRAPCQWLRSPRSHPRNPRFSNSGSRRQRTRLAVCAPSP